ncbi:glycosyltransferase [Rhodococcoides yunnanense]|uniref:glycosyltransferase n=1 Tax=Rhodococcoides yunnanense TaxID=278209 RepID=UPI000933A5B2|nr:glycosyltransferase [Rhodococcus yunnanensis]
MTRPLRIALLGSSNFPIAEPFAGGMEAHIWLLARALTERGHSVTLFAAEGSSVDVAQGVIDVARLELSEISKADITTPARAVSEHHAYLSVMLDLAGELGTHFDVVHNHSLHYLPIAMSPALPMPMLTTLHTPPFAWLESAVAISGSSSCEFAAVSEHAAQQWDPVISGVNVVLNGISLERWPVGPGGDRAVWSGRIVPEKGTHLAIDAARIAGIDLVLAGPISDTDYFDKEIAPRLGSDVTYTGHLSQDELAPLVGGSSVAIVSPVWEEPYGLVVAEALACGTPVAAFSRGGIPEIVDLSCGRLARPDSAEHLAVAITEAAGLSRRDARRRAETVCADSRMVESYLGLYESMLAGVSA